MSSSDAARLAGEFQTILNQFIERILAHGKEAAEKNWGQTWLSMDPPITREGIADALWDRLRQLAAAEAEWDRFKAIGQQFESDARKHFEQSCTNLARADAAESKLTKAREALETIMRGSYLPHETTASDIARLALKEIQ